MIRRILRKAGITVRRMPAPQSVQPRASCTDLSEHWWQTRDIPGMVSDEACQLLYTLCFAQNLEGDVLEVGCWQGKSTSYLAQATIDSKNGSLHVIDHFKGNPGREKRYRLRRRDLSDLEQSFRQRMSRLGLTDVLRVHAMETGTAVGALADDSFRMIFLDGDHRADAVERDVRLFWPKLKAGGWMAFDDYSDRFPGVMAAANALVDRTGARCFGAHEMLFVEAPTPRKGAREGSAGAQP